jgi:hypothetical protein
MARPLFVLLLLCVLLLLLLLLLLVVFAWAAVVVLPRRALLLGVATHTAGPAHSSQKLLRCTHQFYVMGFKIRLRVRDKLLINYIVRNKHKRVSIFLLFFSPTPRPPPQITTTPPHCCACGLATIKIDVSNQLEAEAP